LCRIALLSRGAKLVDNNKRFKADALIKQPILERAFHQLALSYNAKPRAVSSLETFGESALNLIVVLYQSSMSDFAEE